MLDVISDLVKGKRVLLIGFGREGQSTLRVLRQLGSYAELGVADKNPVSGLEGVLVHSGEGYLDCIDQYDVAFKSPGVVLPKEPGEYSCRITSQTEVFLKAFARQVIGVTGTKGKSTVSSLLHHVLHSAGIPCLLAGNIGLPVFEIYPSVTPQTIVILELSCHQLEHCRYSPALSVFLNLYEDHLDHYGSFEKYAAAKKNIYLHQHPLDVLYCGKDVVPARGESVSRTIVPDKSVLPFPSLESLEGVMLRGEHNLGNCAFVYSIAHSFGVTDQEFLQALKTFVPLRHRLEFLGVKDGVQYFDDSISTTVESAISAVESVRNASTLLVGGMDRGICYTRLADYLAQSRLSHVICMYQSGQRVYDMLRDMGTVKPALHYCPDLAAAVETARQVTEPGGACILSPAAASYGYFKNFEERGDAFREAVFGNSPNQ